MSSSNGRRRYIITWSLIGWVHTQIGSCNISILFNLEICICIAELSHHWSFKFSNSSFSSDIIRWLVIFYEKTPHLNNYYNSVLLLCYCVYCRSPAPFSMLKESICWELRYKSHYLVITSFCVKRYLEWSNFSGYMWVQKRTNFRLTKYQYVDQGLFYEWCECTQCKSFTKS